MFKPAGILRQWSASSKLPVAGNAGRGDATTDLNSTLFNDDFEQCTYEQNAQFAQQQTSRWCEEYLRAEDFEKLLSELGADALQEATRHEAAINAALQEHQTTSKQREAVRREQFTKAQTKRADAFARSQEQRQIDSEWYMAFRVESLKDGRQERKKLCEDIKQTCQKQHEKLLDEQEAIFKQNEQRRNDAVEQFVQGLGDNTINSTGETTYNQSPTTDSVAIAVDPPETSNSVGNDPSPSYIAESVRDPSVIQSPSIHSFPDRIPSSSNVSFPNADLRSSNIPFPLADVPTSPSQRPTSDSPAVRRITSSELQGDDAQPDNANQQPDHQEASTSTQMQLFRAAERRREAEFRFSEEERNMEEGKRSTKFQAFQSSTQTRFDDLITGFQNSYSGAERIRDLSEQGRIREFEDEVEMMDSSFDVFLERFKGKANGLQALEEQLHDSMLEDIRALSRQHRKNYEAARKLREKHFADAQALRDTRLGVFVPRKPHFEELGAHGARPTQDFPSHASSPVQLGLVWDEEEEGPIEEAVVEPALTEEMKESEGPSSGRRRPHWGLQRLSPGVGFAPQALLVNEYTQHLPIPDHHSETGSMPEMFGPDAGQHKKFLYRKAKAQRATIFAASSLRQINIFVAAEAKRAREFRKAQAERKAKWSEAKQAQYIEVADNISILNQSFVASEEQRAKEFDSNEKSRVAKFKAGQLKKEETHHNVQEDLTRKCLEAEAERPQALKALQSRLFFEMKEIQIPAFEDEETRREQLHLTSISLAKEKVGYQ